MLYLKKPSNFKPDLEAVGCLVVHKSKILLLKRPENNLYSNCWGFPSGKIEPGETSDEAARRELEEETGIRADILNFLGKAYLIFSDPRLSFIYYVYRHDLNGSEISVELSDEHVGYEFVDPDRIVLFKTVADTDCCVRHFYK